MGKKADLTGVKEAGQEVFSMKDKTEASVLVKKCEVSETKITETTWYKGQEIKNEKIVPCLKMVVIDLANNKEYPFNPTSKRLMSAINEINESVGIIDEKVMIRKTGSGVNTQYTAQVIKSK